MDRSQVSTAPDELKELDGSLDKSLVTHNHQEHPVSATTDPKGNHATTLTARANFMDVLTSDVLSSRHGSVAKDRVG